MVSIHGFVEAAQHAVGVGTNSSAVKMFPSNHARRTIEILQLPFFLASLVFWLILASIVFEIHLLVVHPGQRPWRLSGLQLWHSDLTSQLVIRGIYTILIHSVFCLTTGPKPLTKRVLRIVRSRASSFKWGYPLLSLRSSSSLLRLHLRLPGAIPLLSFLQ